MPLIVMAGLPGTGKTTLANAVIRTIKVEMRRTTPSDQTLTPIILSKDIVRAALFSPDLIEYSTEQDDFCVDIILRVTKYLLGKTPDRIIILDGRTFSKRYQVQVVEETITNMGVKAYWIECICDPEIAKRRLIRDQNEGRHPASNRGPDLYFKVRASAEPLIVNRLTVDTSQPLQKCVAEVNHYLSTAF